MGLGVHSLSLSESGPAGWATKLIDFDYEKFDQLAGGDRVAGCVRDRDVVVWCARPGARGYFVLFPGSGFVTVASLLLCLVSVLFDCFFVLFMLPLPLLLRLFNFQSIPSSLHYQLVHMSCG